MAGKALDIKTYGDPVLRRKAKHVKEVTKEIRSLVGRMWTAMYEESGVGLAAPQVGVSKKVIVVDTREEGEKYAVINPKVVQASEECEFGNEGCLSIPGLEGDVLRSTSIVVEGLSTSGEPVTIEAEGLLARVFQHEIDHLNGVLFVDRIPDEQRAKLERKLRNMAQKTKQTTAVA